MCCTQDVWEGEDPLPHVVHRLRVLDKVLMTGLITCVLEHINTFPNTLIGQRPELR